jgi:hypothetical protein
MKIIMLGCGGIGANVVRQLVPRNPAIDYVIADIRLEAAEALAAQFGDNVTARQVDIHDPASIDAVFAGASLVFNSVGPYYKHALPVIVAALRACIDYIDINDDHDVAETLFLDPTMDRLAREAGVRLIIGCGSTPGLTNVMTRLLADRMDRPRAVHLATVVPLAAEADLAPEDVCLAQMETPIPATAALFQSARSAGAFTILNAAPASTAALSLLPLCDILIVNESELALLAGSDAGSVLDDKGLLSSRHLLGLRLNQSLLVTLGADGLAIVGEDAIQRLAGRPVKVVDTTGAGDCFCGYLAAGLARGYPIDQAAVEANAAASIAVQSFGAAASVPNRATLLQSFGNSPALTS